MLLYLCVCVGLIGGQEQVQVLDAALEHAVLKQLPRLRSACHRVIGSEARLKDAAVRGDFGAVAGKELAGEREAKRKRSTLELT